MKKPITLYGNGGSSNHGNEALVRTFCRVLDPYDITCYSFSPASDLRFGLDEACKIEPFIDGLRKTSLKNVFGALLYRVSGNNDFRFRGMFASFLHNSSETAIFMMGDQYCEPQGTQELYAYVNDRLNAQGCKTVAYGCSINEQILEGPAVADDLRRYHCIVARESFTYRYLKAKGFERVFLVPDLAFLLKSQPCELPAGFSEEVVGVTIGHIPQGQNNYYHDLLRNAVNLVRYILDETHYSVALIPHINNDAISSDIPALKSVHDAFAPSPRVMLLPERRAAEQKYVIGKCRFMVSLRTHAAVAALSSNVPTLLLAFGIKANGIFQDLFGAHENYVIQLPQLSDENRLVEAFRWLEAHEYDVRAHMQAVLPAYIKRAQGCRMIVDSVVNGSELRQADLEG